MEIKLCVWFPKSIKDSKIYVKMKTTNCCFCVEELVQLISVSHGLKTHFIIGLNVFGPSTCSEY